MEISEHTSQTSLYSSFCILVHASTGAAPVTLESLPPGVLAAVIAMFLPVESLGQSLDDATAAHAQPKGIVDQMEQNELEGKKEEERRPTERY